MTLSPSNSSSSKPATWAIQLEDTPFKKIETGTGSAIIGFSWKGVSNIRSHSSQSISAALAEAYPDHTASQIKTRTQEIVNAGLAKRGDYVLGVIGDRIIDKIGYIEDIIPGIFYSGGVGIEVAWSAEDLLVNVSGPVFNEEMSIEKVTPEMLDYTGFDEVILETIVPPVLDVIHEERFEPGAAMMAAEEEADYGDPGYATGMAQSPEESADSKKDPGGRIKVFYGTNRKRTASSELNNYYSAEDAKELSTGWCSVSIPEGHSQGNIERPWGLLSIEILRENPRKHITLENISQVQPEVFYKELTESLNSSGTKAGLVFIHGYNMSFAEAAWRTAQIAWDLPFKGIAGFFSWPSRGKCIPYATDIDSAAASTPFLEEFLERLMVETGVEKLHVIAHSMGNTVLGPALKSLLQKPSLENYLPALRQIVLAAPDIDQDVFRATILPYFTRIGHMRTLYCSDKDRALKLSQFLRSHRPRLGHSGEHLFVANGMDTVDSSNLPSEGNNHSYVFESKEVLGDLFHLFEHNFTPEERRLRSRKKDMLDYWLFAG